MTSLACVSLLPACLALACDPNSGKPTLPAAEASSTVPVASVKLQSSAQVSQAHSAQLRPDAQASAWTGHWKGSGALQKTELKLPENRGVQTAWSKDTGFAHVGRALLDCSVEPTGRASCELRSETNAQPGQVPLPLLRMSGIWDDPKVVTAQVDQAKDPPTLGELSSGTLQATLKTTNEAVGALRLASGDSMLLRSGSFELKRQLPGAGASSPLGTEKTAVQ